MGNFLHRTTMAYLYSVPENELPEAVSNYIESPDLSAVTGYGSQYWIVTGDVVTLMDQAARDVVDAAALEASRDNIANRLDDLESMDRAIALTMLGEFNVLRGRVTAILDAIDNATSLGTLQTAIGAINDLPDRTIAQLKTGLRNNLGS